LTIVATVLVVLVFLPGMFFVGAATSQPSSKAPSFPAPITPVSPMYSLTGAELSGGKFLVATRKLKDPGFSKTVVFLIDYEKQGAMGLVINRPSEVRLAALLPDLKGFEHPTEKVFLGGPVAMSQIRLLIRSKRKPEDSYGVFEDVYMSSSREELKRLIKDGKLETRFRVYAGYAGWAPGQLDREVSMGHWHILPADADIIFHEEPTEIWREMIRRASVLWVRAQGVP
jgi:putative transcriptional regulator